MPAVGTGRAEVQPWRLPAPSYCSLPRLFTRWSRAVFSLCQQNSKAGLIFQADHGVRASFFRPFLFLSPAPLSEGCVIPVVALEGVRGACPQCQGGSLVSLAD